MKPTFNKFDQITHLPLRIFNRVVLMNNIYEDFGKEAAQEYADKFEPFERKQMFLMNAYIKAVGQDRVRKEVVKDLEVVYDSERDDV